VIVAALETVVAEAVDVVPQEEDEVVEEVIEEEVLAEAVAEVVASRA
jgi:hypothetical protein